MVLKNLLANAVCFTDQGRILFGVRHRRGNILFEVHDKGIGIVAAQLNSVFLTSAPME